jgi:hypothetical protein
VDAACLWHVGESLGTLVWLTARMESGMLDPARSMVPMFSERGGLEMSGPFYFSGLFLLLNHAPHSRQNDCDPV